MYKIKGSDEREYGPVSQLKLREWIQQKRATSNTFVSYENGEWKPLSQFPEFANDLASRSAAPVSSGTPRTPQPQTRPAEKAVPSSPRAPETNLGRWLAKSWAIFQRKPLELLTGSVVSLLVLSALSAIPIAGSVLSAALFWPALTGISVIFLKELRGEASDFNDLLAGFKGGFKELLLGGLVSSLLITVGLLLLVIPGIYLLVSWLTFAPLLIYDRKMGFWEALELSRKTVAKEWWNYFLLYAAALLLIVAGVIALGVGVFVAFPIASGMFVCAYEREFRRAPQQSSRPPDHYPRRFQRRRR